MVVLGDSTLESLTPSVNVTLVCHVVEGRAAIGGGTAAAMAIVTSALMSDHQNYISRNTLTGYFLSPQKKKTLCRDIEEEAGRLVTLLEDFLKFYFGEKSPKGDTDENFWRKIPVFFKKRVAKLGEICRHRPVYRLHN
jgi:hypothetical protein